MPKPKWVRWIIQSDLMGVGRGKDFLPHIFRPVGMRTKTWLSICGQYTRTTDIPGQRVIKDRINDYCHNHPHWKNKELRKLLGGTHEGFL